MNKSIYISESLGLEIVEHNKPVVFQEAEYKGKTVKLNQVKRGGDKKQLLIVGGGKGKFSFNKAVEYFITHGDESGKVIFANAPAKKQILVDVFPISPII